MKISITQASQDGMLVLLYVSLEYVKNEIMHLHYVRTDTLAQIRFRYSNQQ